MYGYGSSARAGVGKRGHGGREYRPPKERKDPKSTPPPLKQCSCLCQLDIPEYSLPSQTSGREHVAFGGRDTVTKLERKLRSEFLVHFIVPGRMKAGPVAIVGRTYKEAIPAVAYLLQQMNVLGQVIIRGRFQKRVQDPQDVTIEGVWSLVPEQNTAVAWIFQSPSYYILACFLSEVRPAANSTQKISQTAGSSEGNETHIDNCQEENLGSLSSFLDDFRFRHGSMEGAEFFLHQARLIAIGMGGPQEMQSIYKDVEKTLLETGG